jgi:hypothetical protein
VEHTPRQDHVVSAGVESIPHGTVSGYNHHGCRCDDCRYAAADALQIRKAAQRGPVRDIELEEVEPPGNWIDQARCVGAPTSLFFPHTGGIPHAAKQYCNACPVISQCRAYALDAGPTLRGVWGGLGEAERDRVRHGQPAEVGVGRKPKTAAS